MHIYTTSGILPATIQPSTTTTGTQQTYSQMISHCSQRCLPQFLLLLALLLCGYTPPGKTTPEPSLLLIRNINVVDVVQGRLITGQDVVIKNNIIYYIGAAFSEHIPAESITIDGSGKYLCPGLWDMHFHLCWDKHNDTLLFPVLLANGITGIREMGGDLGIMQQFKQEQQEGSIKAPMIFGAGPMIDGNPPVYKDFSLAADEQTDIATALDSLQKNGTDFFKVYSLLREPQLKAIADYCTKNNKHFAGHLSEYIEPETAIALGQRSIEHLNRLDDIWQLDKQRMDSIIHLMRIHHSFLCPTLITYYLKTKVRDSSIVNTNYAQYIPPSLMKEWQAAWKKRLQRSTQRNDWKELEERFLSQLELVNRVKKSGVLILAGSDFAGMPYVYPGISVHQELRLLVQAGLSNLEALQSATINPALYMQQEHRYGSVRVGNYADLLLLEKNPLDDISHLASIQGVILQGVLLPHHK